MTSVVAPPVPPRPVSPAPAYPVRLTAAPVPDRPSRGLWLVKWLLVIPHVVVLVFLWTAFVLLSVVAFVSILVTGRYPRAVFDFNVGVLRWSWRVGYYSYSALGTDRYPPFSLHPDPTYPADLHVDYPERLSRGLVLVKWWLLALPHYLVVWFLTGAGATAARESGAAEWSWEGGLIAVLALVAGVALLFTGRHPQSLYDLMLGFNRWVYRVVGYAGLMTDAYPPFRLDQGGRDGPQDTPGWSGTQGATSHWTAGPVTAVTAGTVAVLLGLSLSAAGATLLNAGDDGYVTSPTRTVQTDGYAITSDELVLEGAGVDEALGQVRVRAEATDGSALFLGVAPAGAAQEYLSGVEHTVVTGPLTLDLDEVAGGPPAAPPQQSDAWVTSSAGTGQQVVELSAQPGSWVVVVMSADGSPGLRADLDVAATFPWLASAATGLVVVAGLLLLSGAAAVVLGVRAASSTEPAEVPTSA